jgi:hypothetical protein
MSNAHRMKHALIIGAALLALTTLPVVAQGDCPAGYACVEYGSPPQVIELDPADGFYIAVVVEERTLTITDFSGSHSGETVTLAGYVQHDSTYELEGTHEVPRTGIYANASLGDIFTLQESP